jgi:type I restriction enzyme, R subunit
MDALPETRERYSSHIPTLKTLISLGWHYLSPAECLTKRGDKRSVVMKEVLIESLRQRRFEYKGDSYPLSSNAIEQIVRELTSPALNEGLLEASRRLYDKLCLGVTVTEFIDGKKHAPTIPLIEWEDLSKNSFLITEALEVLSTAGTHTRRPDIVCYVNGLPLVVIEAKRPNTGNPNKRIIDEGISQTLRNQRNNEIPRLFAYTQLLLSVSATDGRYGTTGTDRKFWARWREETFPESYIRSVKNQPLAPGPVEALFADRPAKLRHDFERRWANEALPTEQDRLLIGLLSPQRLLEFVRYFILYDRKAGKIAARYPQAFGIKALIEQINQRTPAGGRQGGVLWHTTGSGKSFTMVFLCKALLLHPALSECRILVVTDRIDLEKQLAGTFLSGGAFGSHISARKAGEQAKTRSGKDLAKRIGQGTERIVFAIINKFNSASKQPECYNPSDKLIVLVDEGHRSQGGENHARMRKALPNAATIAFTGTPLLKEDKTTNKFGPIVHAYTMQQAVEDGTVTPLRYEERRPVLSINEQVIDNWFDKITAGLSEKQKSDLKQRYTRKGEIYTSANRLELIAWDVAVHFSENIKALKLGLKAQLACDSKLSAVRYKKYLDRTGLVSSAVVISPPECREGNQEVDETKSPEVQKWWQENVGNDAQGYERAVVEDFGRDGDPDLLIVVDKLLTGFDEPRNSVLYIDKPLKEHNLIQAIARVNRLHEEKQFGLLIDYRGILEELDTAIRKFQDLALRTQGGYDIDDIEGLYHQMGVEYKQLPRLHDQLWAFFADVKNRQDLEQYRQRLIPLYAEDSEGHGYDKRQKVREDFYAALTVFGLCLKLALSSRSFYEDSSFTESMIGQYKADLRFFSKLRKIARQDAQETVDYSHYEEQIQRLVDKQVIGTAVRESDGAYLVNELGQEPPEAWSKEKTRNESDLIRTRLKRTIEEDLAIDPYAQRVFSALLKQAIAEAEALFDHPLKQYALFKDLEEKVEARQVEGMPEVLADNPHARAYYGAIRLVLGQAAFNEYNPTEIDALADEALNIDHIVDKAVAEHSLNPQSIEAEIHKGLLPGLFKQVGMEKAKAIIEEVIRIVRVGLEHENC